MSHRALAVVILIGLGIAAATFVETQRTYFWALLSTPAVGAYGMSRADLPPPEIRARARARADALYEKAAWTQRVSYACAALSLAGIVVAAWRNRRDVRSWHWLSFLGLGLLLTIFFMDHATTWDGPPGLVLAALAAFALAASVIDLRRGKEGAPGRPVAWVTMLLSLVVGFVLLA